MAVKPSAEMVAMAIIQRAHPDVRYPPDVAQSVVNALRRAGYLRDAPHCGGACAPDPAFSMEELDMDKLIAGLLGDSSAGAQDVVPQGPAGGNPGLRFRDLPTFWTRFPGDDDEETPA